MIETTYLIWKLTIFFSVPIGLDLISYIYDKNHVKTCVNLKIKF